MDNIVSAAAYIFAPDENNRWCILCGKRSGNDPIHQGGLYDVPVGMREPNESIQETARRETYEETGINLSPSMFRFVDKQPWKDRRGRTWYGSNFLCILNKCLTIGKGDWEHDGFMWLPIEKVNTLNWAYGMGNVINKYYQAYINKDNSRKMIVTEEQFKKLINRMRLNS